MRTSVGCDCCCQGEDERLKTVLGRRKLSDLVAENQPVYASPLNCCIDINLIFGVPKCLSGIWEESCIQYIAQRDTKIFNNTSKQGNNLL